MEERIKELAKGKTGSKKEIAKEIQRQLLWDTNNHIPLTFIIENLE
jgi:hypothetical protein